MSWKKIHKKKALTGQVQVTKLNTVTTLNYNGKNGKNMVIKWERKERVSLLDSFF